ncbi:phage major capsid protein [Listeria monocytogenes]|nr:phage major capsid protein [Listeria monocytogenes]
MGNVDFKTKQNRLPVPMGVNHPNESKSYEGWKTLFEKKEYNAKDFQMYEDYMERKAGFSGIAGQGAEWQPENLAAEILGQVSISSKVRTALRVIPTTSDDYLMAVDKTAWTTKVSEKGVQGVASMPADTNATTGAIKFAHKKTAATTILTSEFIEDSTPSSMEMVRESAGIALAETEEKDLFFQHATVGLETVAKDNTPTAGSEKVISETALLDTVDAMPVKYLDDPKDLVMFIHPLLYRRMIRFANFTSVDKAGPRATILTGAVGSFYGIDVFVSTGMSSTTVYPVVIVHKRAALIGARRELRIKQFDIAGDQQRLELTMRSDIQYPYLGNTTAGKADGVIKEKFKLV